MSDLRIYQNKRDVESLITAGNGKLYIVSGEGEVGTKREYTGEQTPGVIYNALKKEWCGGARWAYLDTAEGDYASLLR